MIGGVARARDDLAAAQLLSTNGFAAQAVICSFHGALHAAETALLVTGETQAAPPEVVSAFVQRLVRERGLDPEAGRLLRSLYNRCRQAEHTYDPVPQAEAPDAVKDATAVVDAVAAWLHEPIRTPDAPAPARAIRRNR